jgi:hypothetical protein
MYWKFVDTLSNKTDKYGFVNEHEIRIATWITLVLWLFSLFLVLFKANYDIPLFIVWTIWLDFVLKVFVDPKFSIFWNIVKLFIRKKESLWVGAVQKRFAWSIWVFISSFVIFCLLVLWKYTSITNPALEQIWQSTQINLQNWKLIVTPMNPAIIACVICIVFMWFESVAWYCIWCSIYAKLVKKWWMKRYTWQNCANGECKL